MNESRSTLVPVAIGYGFPETQVAVSYLRAYGINVVVVENWHHGSVAWYLMLALGGMRVCVPKSQFADAVALLADIPDQNEGLSRPYARSRALNACVAILILALSGIVIPAPARGFFCFVWREQATLPAQPDS